MEIRAAISNRLQSLRPANLLFGGLYHLGRATGRYKNFRAADFCGIRGDRERYPHLNIGRHLNYDPKLDMLKFDDNADLRKIANDVLRNELFFYELFSPSAKRLNLKDCLGFKVSGSEKVLAFVSILKLYVENTIRWHLGRDMFGAKVEIRALDLGALGLEKGFEALGDYMGRSREVISKLAIVRAPGSPLHMGVVLKGTNLSFADGTEAVQRGEIFHTIWHAEEGIAGFKGDNRFIEETWATALWLYVYQAFKGRAERRVRKNTSPHDLKFRDYIALRAFVGKGIVSDAIKGSAQDKGYFHGLYGILTPGLKLINHLLPEAERNNIFIKALFEGSAPKVIKAVDDLLGEGAYKEIFHNWDTIFKRIDLIRARAEASGADFKEILKAMFSEEEMLPTLLDNKLIALIWLSGEINGRAGLVLGLIEDIHGAALKSGRSEKITIEAWQKALEESGRKKEADLIEKEKVKYADILSRLNSAVMNKGLEVESKFLVGRDTLIAAAAISNIGDFSAGTATKEEQKNTYFDSAELSILEGKGTLRTREVAGRFEATLKLPSSEVSGENSLSRIEHNEELPSIAGMQGSSVFSTARRLFKIERLAVVFTTKNERKTILFENGRSKIEVALDTVTYYDGRGAVFCEEHEIEVENKGASQEQYQAFVNALQEKLKLSGNMHPKYVRGIIYLGLSR